MKPQYFFECQNEYKGLGFVIQKCSTICFTLIKIWCKFLIFDKYEPLTAVFYNFLHCNEDIETIKVFKTLSKIKNFDKI